GKATVFPAVSVVLREGAYGVYPNPVVNDQQFRLSLDEPETALVNFYGVDGRSMPVQKLGVESGNLLLKVTGKLSSGVYILTVDERGQTRKHRLVVE
ncbi:T9SS type A sorting domain-containing protein, partial [Spirosoma sp. HMF4905]